MRDESENQFNPHDILDMALWPITYKSMRYLTFLLLLTLTSQLLGQELKKGLLMPNPDGSFKTCCIYVPPTGLSAYDKPNGNKVTSINLGSQDHNKEVYEAFIQKNGESIKFDYSNFHMVGYEIMAMVYVDKSDGYVKTNNGYWLQIEELESKGLVLTNWMDYLVNKEDVLGWYANDPGLNLRSEPSVDSNVILTLKGDLFEITPTKEVKGLWCKVKVTQYREHPCVGEGSLIIRTYTGWVKLLDNNQTPNVWNYGKGC